MRPPGLHWWRLLVMFWALPTACKLQMLRCSWRTCSVSDLRTSLTDFTRFLSKTFCETNVRMFDCDSDWKFFRFYSRPCVPSAVFGWRALCVHLTCLTWRFRGHRVIATGHWSLGLMSGHWKATGISLPSTSQSDSMLASFWQANMQGTLRSSIHQPLLKRTC